MAQERAACPTKPSVPQVCHAPVQNWHMVMPSTEAPSFSSLKRTLLTHLLHPRSTARSHAAPHGPLAPPAPSISIPFHDELQ